jgi:hypothetical protein
MQMQNILEVHISFKMQHFYEARSYAATISDRMIDLDHLQELNELSDEQEGLDIQDIRGRNR